MGHLERAAFFVILAIMIIILIVMLKQGNAREEEASIFQVSIIINDVNDDYWENFSKGVNSAAVDYNVDVHFVTLLDGVSAENQLYYLEREIRNNADAIVISAVDGESLAQWLDAESPDIPIITVGEEVCSDQVKMYINLNDYAMGLKLAQDIGQAGGVRSCTILIMQDSGSCIQKRLNGLTYGLTEEGIAYTVREVAEDSWGSVTTHDDAAIALEPPVLEKLIEEVYGEIKLYGIGFTNEILYSLDEGDIQGIVVLSDYAAGYQSITSTINALERNAQPDEILMRCFSASRENIYSGPVEQVLFPIS